MRRFCIAFVLILGLSSAQTAAPRTVVVSAFGDGSKQTSSIRVLRYATDKEELLVRIGDRFEAGDELTAISDVTIELTCPEGSAVKFSGRFRAFISAPRDKHEDCAINLLAGQADIITDNPTSIESGEKIAGSKGTVYSIRVNRDAQGSTLLCSVLDGEVEVRSQSGDQDRVKVGSKMIWSPAGERVQNLSTDDIKSASALYARIDAVKATMAGVPTTKDTVADLETSYLRVFQTPADAEARVELAAKQTNLKITSAAIYQLDRAEKLTPSKDKAQLARVAAVRSVTYQESGDSKKAAEQAAKAQKIDPNVLSNENLAKYKIDPARIPAPRTTASTGNYDRDVASRQTTNSAGTQAGRVGTAAATTPNTVGTKPATSSANAQVARAGTASTATRTATNAALPESKALMDMISRKQYVEAAAGFVSRLKQLGENPRDAYGAALAYSKVPQKAEAMRYAKLAIDLNGKQKQLTDAELKACRDIQSAR